MEGPQGLKGRCSLGVSWTAVVQGVLLLGNQALDAIEGSGNQRSDYLRLLCCSTPAGPGS
jgi:hypothetical protein